MPGISGSYQLLQSAVSPLGTRRAYSLLVDYHGGATVGFSYEVVVLPIQAKIDLKRLPDPVWSAYSTYPDRLSWLASRTSLLKSNNRTGI